MTPELAELSRTIEPRELGRRIKAARVAAGMTQAQVAADDVTTAYVSRIEDGQRRPEAGLLERMASRMNTTLEALLLGISSDKQLELRLALDYAELSLASGDAAAALSGADGVLAELPDSSPAGIRRAAMQVRAGALEALGDLDAAIMALEDLTSQPHPDAAWLKGLIALSRCYRDSGDLGRAIAVGEQASAVIDELGIAGLTEAIQLTITVAGAYMIRGDAGYAMRTCKRALESADRYDSPIAKASAYWNASVIEATNGSTGIALDMAKKALALFELGEDSRNIARLRTEVAIMQLMQDPPDALGAIETLERAEVETAWTQSSAIDIANQLRARSRAHFLLGEHDLALTYLQRGLDQAPANAPVLMASLYVLQGQIAASDGHVTDARNLYQSAVQLLSGVGADREAAQLWFELGTLLDNLGESQGALDAFRRAAASTGLRNAPARTSIHAQ